MAECQSNYRPCFSGLVYDNRATEVNHAHSFNLRRLDRARSDHCSPVALRDHSLRDKIIRRPNALVSFVQMFSLPVVQVELGSLQTNCAAFI